MYKYGPQLGFGIVILVALAYLCFFVVPEGKQAVVIEFGKIKPPAIKETGLHFKLPWREARILEKRILNWDGKEERVPTKENKYIIVDTTARWRIEDPVRFIQDLVSVDEAESRIESWIDSATKKVVSNHNLVETVRNSNKIIEAAEKVKQKSAQKNGEDISIDELVEEEVVGELEKISVGRKVLTDKIIAAARPKMEARGLALIDVQLKRVAMEESVEKEVYNRMITERKRIANKIRSVGKGEQAKIRGRTSHDLQEIQSTAYRKVQEVKGEAEAKAIAIYAEAMKRDPQFYEFTRTLEAYRNGLRDDSQFIMSSQADFLKFLKEGPNAK